MFAFVHCRPDFKFKEHLRDESSYEDQPKRQILKRESASFEEVSEPRAAHRGEAASAALKAVQNAFPGQSDRTRFECGSFRFPTMFYTAEHRV